MKHLNSIIMARAGAAALTVFRMRVVERRSLDRMLRRDKVALQNAERSFAQAVNALASWCDENLA